MWWRYQDSMCPIVHQKCHIIRTKLSELIDSPFTKAQNRSKDHFDFEFLTTFSPGKKTESGELKTIQNST